MDLYGNLPFPATGLAEAATGFPRGIEAPAIVNHSTRSYLYGRSRPTWEQLMAREPSLHDYDDSHDANPEGRS
ncbi:hypothetical protein [Saccharothrix hoggarensis]|uniref:Uncharacterized protein n=2 Tax=Saccharothrix hoggarensis TaxID=913853 RepID=A0ABW3R589_9PSEU